ncbi:MAG: cobalt-precorrin-8X methylmutase [Hydrococcus sp. RU_2_2]|jgi:precorrin-8X/cobalt-precorrin-8 methylmutase|nr:cobalt-precorrin-8X methylmutase [Hydrococcus sp. RU_2_2]NJP19277.1 cobalt-precorrin-8X methylmutase [Hydrococcus sp. CRU_1_1]
MGQGERLNHPIVEESFAIIDREIGNHSLKAWEYAIARRVIHTTADFEYLNLLKFSSGAIDSGIACLRSQVPIVTDVGMVKQGITTMLAKTFNNIAIAAVERVAVADDGKTRTQTGMLQCFDEYPQGIYAIGNAPTALLALCDRITQSNLKPGLIIGAPVGFVSVVESKEALKRLDVPKIWVEGRKGGSPVAAAILNALLVLAWENFSATSDQ